MPTSCCAYNCSERAVPGGSVAFHRFPTKNEMLFRAWCVALRRKDFHPTWASRVCSKHFTKDSYEQGYKNPKLKRDAVPTIFDFDKKVGKRHYFTKKMKRVKSYKSTPSRFNILDCESDEDTKSSSEIFSFEEEPNVVEVIKLKRECIDEESGNELHQEQFRTSEDSADGTTENAMAVDELVKIDSDPSDEFANMWNENEILRQTIHHLSKKVERFKCLTNVLRSNDLISEEAAEVLRCTIDM